MEWQLQTAKNQFSKLVETARKQGPQIVTFRGRRAAIVLSARDYDRLIAGRPTLADHLLTGPPWDDDLVDVVNARTKAPSRDAPV